MYRLTERIMSSIVSSFFAKIERACAKQLRKIKVISLI